ncbi:hypothetical protein BLNAU_10654 [Blattamonas nauphoetae]|uniref:Uncharacterized protein n=1 Tax=Blattamonas nauphoetae TaxID=2049346 RepID=A0ABQ9XPH2_9EUKA|nr:hypothetical protein BLNAU_10654 [Blattamonas nauphoetae]
MIEVPMREGQKLKISETVSHPSLISSCSSKGDVGALDVALVSSGTLTISDTSFVSCSATGNGGALFVSLSASTSPSTSFPSLIFGSGSDCNNGILGSKVFVQN